MQETQEHRALRISIENEYRQYGVHLNPSTYGQASEAEMRTAAEQIQAKRKKRAGARALQQKYGNDAADRIVSKHRGTSTRLKR